MAANASATLAVDNLPLEEQIRRRAYEIYLERGDRSGSATGDWLQAEEEILRAQQQRQQPGAPPNAPARRARSHKEAA